ncbi:MAG: hypothetical protein AAFX92_03910 [Pseudomonadota bacterium]
MSRVHNNHIVQAMADTMLDLLDQENAVTESGLERSGFSTDQIRDFKTPARLMADQIRPGAFEKPIAA